MRVPGMDYRRQNELGRSSGHSFAAAVLEQVVGEGVGIADGMNMVVKEDKTGYAPRVEGEGSEYMMDEVQVAEWTRPMIVEVVVVGVVFVDGNWVRPRKVQQVQQVQHPHRPTPKWLLRPIAPAWAFSGNWW